jgi:cysteine desulfuration protein SufE
MSTIPEKQREFVENLELLPDTEERFKYLLQLGRRFPALPEDLRDEKNLLPGCMSQLWFCPEMRDGKCYFHMDADAAIVKGVAAMLCSLYSGETPEDVIAHEPHFLQECGLTMHLSSRRLSGLGNLRSAIKAFAVSQAS